MRVAVLIPCYNEEKTVATVVADFRANLPEAAIYVYDNNSSDRTAEAARAAGAIVCTERRQGKGFVIRRMFRDVDADIYVMVDGDATYQSSMAPKMVAHLVEENLDMVVGRRCAVDLQGAYRPGHVLGNRLFTTCIAVLFGKSFDDIFSGYRVFSRRFVKSFPVTSAGFEIETELAVHSLDQGMAVAEMDTEYYARPEGSHSKLNTFRDGLRILRTIITFMRHYRPLAFYSLLALVLSIVSVGLAIPIILDFLAYGTVERMPTAILCTGIAILAAISVTCGLILNSVSRVHKSIIQLHYLSR
jgi:glycosyltransferase involved in cell wall biosynthesis